MKGFFLALTRNPISLIGTAITTAAGILTFTLFLVELFGHRGSPYMGILAYVVLPGVFVLGLLIIPLGVMRERRRMRRVAAAGVAPPAFPIIDLNLHRTRARVLTFIVLTSVNIVILAVATYKAVEVMDSTSFCGQACHSVMEPEFTAYSRSPHANVRCVECHIGGGANWFVKSKLSGTWQLVSVSFDLYPRPIPTPVHNLRPARETCEACHWPVKFVGDRLKVIDHFANDEPNTPTKTVLLLRVGGLQGRASKGIHWHVDPNVLIRYRSDESREKISEIEMTAGSEPPKIFRAESAGEESPPESEWRVMDCIDCHNRPTHIYRLPEDEVDRALADGLIAVDLPYVRREGVRILKLSWASREEAEEGIARELNAFYRQNYPQLADSRKAEIEQAAAALYEGHRSNVFPGMNITWGTYPNHIGHERWDGCFRCHDDSHATAEGETISQDCSTCHSLLAMEEEDPEILRNLEP